MTTFLSPIEVHSAFSVEEYVAHLKAGAADWREAHRTTAAQKAGVLRWRIDVSGNYVVIKPTRSALAVVMWGNYKPIFVGQVDAASSGSVLRGQLEVEEWLIGVSYSRPALLTLLVVGVAVWLAAFFALSTFSSFGPPWFMLAIAAAYGFAMVKHTGTARKAFVGFLEIAGGVDPASGSESQRTP